MNKLLVIVPYRNREQHLAQFIPYITSILNEQKIENKIIIEKVYSEDDQQAFASFNIKNTHIKFFITLQK